MAAAKSKLTHEQWVAVRKRWETDPRDGYAWLVDDLDLPVSAPAVRKVAIRDGWAKVSKVSNKVSKVSQENHVKVSETISETIEEAAVGRPTLFKPEYVEQAYRLCLLGATDAELAEFFGVCERTINHWKVSQDEFLQSIRRGKAAADATVAESLYKLSKVTTQYPMSVTLLTANDMDQLKATLWKEIGVALERIRRGVHGWIAQHVEILADASCRVVGFEQIWFVESKTANEKTANKMAGRHGEWLLIIGDEASTLPDNVLTTLTGALTEQHNRMLLTSQPTRNAGYFYRTHNDLSVKNGGEWVDLVFDSFDSPFVSDDALMELWNAYDDDERNVRFIGNDEHFGWMVLGDIASGEGLRDKSSCVIVRVIGYGDIGPDARRVEVVEIPVLTNRIRSNTFASVLADAGNDYSGVTYVVDAGGLGANVCQDLEDMGKNIHRVNWGEPCFKKMNKNRYLNLRAQAMHQAARAAKEGRLSVLTSDYKKVMLGQSARIPRVFTDKGRMKVPPKGRMLS